MNQKGFMGILNVIVFFCALALIALFIVLGEPILDAMLDSSNAAPEGGTARLIIFGASIIIFFAGLWFLTRPEGQLGVNL